MSELIGYKCPCCGAPLKFSSQDQKLACASCGNTFTEEQLKAFGIGDPAAGQPEPLRWSGGNNGELDGAGMASYVCPSCGAEIIADQSTGATECPYCGNPAIVPGKFAGAGRPDRIIPFKLDRQAAEQALKRFYSGKKLLPDAFTAHNRVEKIAGVYVPFWLFDCAAEADIVYDAARTTRRSDQDYDYEKTDHYLVSRGGSLAFRKIPVAGTAKLDPSYMEGIEPFRYEDLAPFEQKYLPGYLANKYDVAAQQSQERADARIRDSVGEEFRSTVTGYDTVTERRKDIRLKEGTMQYVLLPVWMLTTKYGGRNFTFAMNGQTGRLVGQLPVDKGKYWKWLIALAAGILLAAQLAIYFMTGAFGAANLLTREIVAAAIALIAALITVSVMKGGMDTAVRRYGAGDYIQPGSLAISRRQDQFLYSKTERTPKAKGASPDPGRRPVQPHR